MYILGCAEKIFKFFSLDNVKISSEMTYNIL